MGYNKEYAKKVYAGLTKRGYTADELGDETKFVERMADEGNRKYLYDQVQKRGDAKMGSWERFNSKMMEAAPQVVTAPQVEAEPQQGFFDKVKGGIADVVKAAPQLGADKSAYTFTTEELERMDKPEKPQGTVWGEESIATVKLPEIKPFNVKLSERQLKELREQPEPERNEAVESGSFLTDEHKKAREEFDKGLTPIQRMQMKDGSLSALNAPDIPKNLKYDYDFKKEFGYFPGGSDTEFWNFLKTKTGEEYQMKMFGRPLSDYEIAKLSEDARRLGFWGTVGQGFKRLGYGLKGVELELAEGIADLFGVEHAKENINEERERILTAQDNFKPTAEGVGGFVAEMIPQMTGTGLGLLVSAVNPAAGAAIVNASTAAQVASSMGSTALEARRAGASDAQTAIAMLLSGGAELLSEKYVNSKYIKRIMPKAADVVAEAGDKALESELNKLLQTARKELGGKFTAKTAKDLVGDMFVEGASEFSAEAVQALIPIVYEHKEDFPNIVEVFNAGLEGFAGGVFMGGIFSGTSSLIQSRANNRRRREQGFVDVANVEIGGKPTFVEVLGKDKDGNFVVLNGDETVAIKETQIKERKRFDYNDFRNAEVEYAREIGYEQEPTGENAVKEANEYTNARNEVVKVLSLAEDADVDAMLEGRTAEEIAMGDTEIEDAVNNYIKARARRDGFRERYQEERDRQFAESDRSVDETANDGMVYTTTAPSGEKVIITGGKVVLDNEGYIDVNQSEGLVAMFPDSSRKPVRPGDLREKVEVSNAEETKAARRASIEERWRTEFESAENAYVEQQKRAEGVVFDVTDKEGTHRVEVVKEGKDFSNILLDGVPQKMSTEELNSWKQEAGVTQEENGVVPVVEGQKGENAEKAVEEVGEVAAPVVEAPKTALEQIPRNEKNVPLYEQVDSELAWDGVVEEAGGNEEIAMVAVNSMVEDKKKALAAAEKAKAKAGATITEKIAAENKRVANIERAKADLAKWEEIAGVKAKRAVAQAETAPVVESAPVEDNTPQSQSEPTPQATNEMQEADLTEDVKTEDVNQSENNLEMVAEGGNAPGQSGVVGNNNANTLQNGNNELNLQKENESDNESNQNDIPVGGQVSQSVPQGEHGTQDSQVSGAQETAARLRERIESAQGDSKSGLREVENRVTREFAQENGLWIEDEFKLGVPFPSGDEHNNYIDAENQVVYKVNNRMHTPSVLDLLDRIEHHNKYFPDSKYSLVGFTSVSKNGDVMPVFAQGFVPDARMATVDEIDSYMGTLGFTRVGDGRYSNGEVVIKDLKPRNVLADADGDIYVVDAEFEQENTKKSEETAENGGEKMYSPEELAEAKEQLGELNATSAPEFAARLFSIKPWKTLKEANAALKELLASYGETLNGQSLAVMPFLDKAQGLIREYNKSQEPRLKEGTADSEPIKDEAPVTSETTEQPETNEVANAGPVNIETLQLNMSEEDFNALLSSGDKAAISEYLAELDGALRIDENSPFAGQVALREEYRKAVEQYGKENIPAEVMDDLNSRMQPYSDLSRAIFDRKYALQDKLREIEASEAQAKEQDDKEAKAEHKQTAFGGFLAGKSDVGASTAEKALNKKYNFDGKVMTVAEFVEDAVGNGNVKLSAIEEPKYKGASRAAWNRMDARQQEADAKRVKESGTKTVYTVNDHDLGKTAYDYAKFLLDKKAEQEKAAAKQKVKDAIEPFAKEKAAEQATIKIEDVGEKIGGAKKDRFAEGMARIKAELEETDETLTDKLAKLPVSQVFNFDLEKLREGGISNEAISFIKIVKDYLPAKPRKTYKIRSWVNNTLALYKLCLEAGTNWDRVNTLLNSPQFTSSSLKEQFDAYMAIGGFDSGMNIGNAKLRQLDNKSGRYDESGKFVTLAGKWYVRDAGKHGGIYDTKEEAVNALKAFAGDKAGVTSSGKKKEVKFAVYQRRQDKSIFIAVKGKSDIVIQDGFASSKEAFDYIEANNAELQERYRALLDKTNADFEDNRPREGRDYRDGKDIPAEEFRTTFGFRGVEFGNWMTQEDRRKALNECYDALMDLAAVCKVSPQALSLGGTLGMAFGARGSGRFSAHYEPGKLVINLTKTKGAGSLAHEWFHALDNYFAKMGSEGLDVYATAGEGLFPEGISSIGKRYYDRKSGQMLTEEEYNERMNSHEMRSEMADAWKSLMETLKKSDYYKRSLAYAGLHNSNYWSRPTELGARAFSTWVENELSKQGASNDYLANNPRFLVSEATDEQSRFMPYPFDADATWMEEAFGNLFEVMQEKTTEDGKAVLYRSAERAGRKINKEAEEFNKTHKGGATVVNIDPNNLETELAEEEFTVEEIEEVKNRVKKGGRGFYDPERNLIYLFDPELNGAYLDSFCWHEDTHKAIADLDIEQELLDEFFGYLSPKSKKSFEALAEKAGYKRNEYAEECVAYCVEGLSQNDMAFDLLSIATGATEEGLKRQKEIIQPLIVYIRNGRQEERFIRNGRQESRSVLGENVFGDEMYDNATQELSEETGATGGLAEEEIAMLEASTGYSRDEIIEIFGDELNRSGAGPLTDREVVMESDPYSKVLGKPRYYGKRQREFVARQRRRMAEKARQVAEKLNLDNVEVLESTEGLTGKKATSKGWFDPRTGKITVVVPNHGSTGDIVETVLHEAVAHYGLRKLFGENFKNFLDNVYRNVTPEIRAEITELAKKHGWDFHTATEEYLASLAENTNFEKVNPSLWSNIKSFFMKMLAKVGITLDEPLGDNELRYILWRSHQNLVNPGWFNVFGQVEDIAKQYELGVGNYQMENGSLPSVAEATAPLGQGSSLVAEDDSALLHRKGGAPGSAEEKERQNRLKENAKAIRRLHNTTSRFSLTALRNLGFALETQEQREMHDRLFAERDAMSGRENAVSVEVNPQAMTLQERITESLLKMAEQNKDNVELRLSAIRAYGRDLANVIKLMRAQRGYDRNTVNMFVSLAKMYLRNNAVSGMSSYDISRLLGLISRANGGYGQQVMRAAEQIAEIITKSHTRELEDIVRKQIKTGAEKVNASGVVVQDGVDVVGKRVLNTFRDAINMTSEEEFEKAFREAFERVVKFPNDVELKAACDAMVIAKEYRDNIVEAKKQESELLKSINQYSNIRSQYDRGEITRREYNEFVDAVRKSLIELRSRMVDDYQRIIHALGGDISEGMKRAKEFREREIARVEKIHNMAEADMSGVSKSAERKKRGFWRKATDYVAFKNPLAKVIAEGLGTYNEFMKFFGRNAIGGKGRLYDYFIGRYTEVQNQEWVEKQKDIKKIDEQCKKVFGKGFKDVMRDSEKNSGVVLEYWNGGERVSRDLSIGQLMYIYMTAKQTDGEMKLRGMGITEETVNKAVAVLPARYKVFADWVQSDFLPEMRPRLNEVHKRMFGASMSEVKNYFPLVVNTDARQAEVDLNSVMPITPSTITGSIIKRKVNATPLNLESNAFNVLLNHISDMEHWAAFAEFTRDNNTLIGDKDFMNRVKNSRDLRFGDGEAIWNNFVETARITTGNYRAKKDEWANVMKGVSSAKITFGYYTALKQFLSAPGLWLEASTASIIKATANPLGSWRWAIENLPGFEERWKGRTAGNERLADSDSDWSIWDNKIVKAAREAGMKPNAFVDAVVVSTGARAVYDSRKRFYKALGLSRDEQHKRALKDAAVAYNETQQSAQGAYLSILQKEGGFKAMVMTLYRNSQMAYSRKVTGSMAELYKKAVRWKVILDNEEKKYLEMGLSEEDAKKEANKALLKSAGKDVATLVMFGYVLNMVWYLGEQLPYLLFGDDEEEKEKIKDTALKIGATGMFEGFALGNVAKDLYVKGVTGNRYSSDMLTTPFASDAEKIINRFANDGTLAGMSQLLILGAETATGISPQRLIDDVAAVIDYCNGDLDKATKVTLLTTRLAKVPQSQIDKLYLEEALGGDVVALAERYAEYKRLRDYPLNIGDDKILEKYAERFKKAHNEDLKEIVRDENAYEGYFSNASPEEKIKLAGYRGGYLEELTGKKAEEVLTGRELVYYTLYGRKEQNLVYSAMTTPDDVDDEICIEMMMSELKPIYEGLEKAEDRTAYANEYQKEIGLYKRLDEIEQGVGNCKSAMKKIGEEYPDYAQDFMTTIRTLRAEAVELINKYRNE